MRGGGAQLRFGSAGVLHWGHYCFVMGLHVGPCLRWCRLRRYVFAGCRLVGRLVWAGSVEVLVAGLGALWPWIAFFGVRRLFLVYVWMAVRVVCAVGWAWGCPWA